MTFLEDGNHTAVTEFILLGLTEDPVLRVILFTIILCIYLVTVCGNLSTILLIRVSSQLHHPMYFLLSHLASVDIGISSSVTPNMLVNFLVSQNIISYLGCGIQLSSADFFGSVECFLLAAMAYDRFAIVYFFSFQFCGPNRINHFFCDIAPLMELTRSDVSVFAVVTSFSAGSVIVITVFVIAISYFCILITMLKMNSMEGRHKAFTTCTSHLTAVILYYGTITFIYVMPKSSYSTDQNKVVSLFYMVVIPMLNPLIYSLRNNEIKGALKRQLGTFASSCSRTFRVNQFFCDFAPLMELSCSDVSVSAVVTSFSTGSVVMITVLVIAISYIYILITILKMRSTEGRHKAFSTCTSHLTAVTLFYGTVTFICVMPKSKNSTHQNKVVSVFYMVVIPMLNPLIYSLRNNEIKGALKRQL
ncbi:hypothetical protein STEG23_005559, partial [Scotinomys teguina]